MGIQRQKIEWTTGSDGYPKPLGIYAHKDGDMVDYADHLADKAAALAEKDSDIQNGARDYCELVDISDARHVEIEKLRAALAEKDEQIERLKKAGDELAGYNGSRNRHAWFAACAGEG